MRCFFYLNPKTALEFLTGQLRDSWAPVIKKKSAQSAKSAGKIIPQISRILQIGLVTNCQSLHFLKSV